MAPAAAASTPSSASLRVRKAVSSPSQDSSVLRRPAEREPTTSQPPPLGPPRRSSLHEPSRSHARAAPAAKAVVDPVASAPRSAPTPTKSNSSRRESLIPRIGRQASQPLPASTRQRDENNATSANTATARALMPPAAAAGGRREKTHGERSWLSATLRSVTRRHQAPASTAATTASSSSSAAPTSAAPSGIPSASSRRLSGATLTPQQHQQHSTSSKRRQPTTRV